MTPPAGRGSGPQRALAYRRPLPFPAMEISPARKRFLWGVLAGVVVLNALIFAWDRLQARSSPE